MLHGKESNLRSMLDLLDQTSPDEVVDLERLYLLSIENDTASSIAHRSGVLHPSGAGSCRRAAILSYRNVRPTNRRSKDFSELVDLGHMVHGHIQAKCHRLAEILKPHGVTFRFADEVPYNKETDDLFLYLRIGGTTDGVVEIETRQWMQRIILEVKSMGKTVKDQVVKLGSLDKHLQQANLYAFRFDAPAIALWYYNKEDSKRIVKRHLFDKEIFAKAVEYFEELNKHIDAGTIPARDESWFECKECPYRTMCAPSVLRQQQGGVPPIPTKTLRRRKK